MDPEEKKQRDAEDQARLNKLQDFKVRSFNEVGGGGSQIANNRAIKHGHRSHYMPLALVLPRGDQWYLFRKSLIRRDEGGHTLSTVNSTVLTQPLRV